MYILLSGFVFIALMLIGAIFGILVYIIRIPDNLKHIPSPPALEWIRNMYQAKPLDIKIKEISKECLEKSKIQRYFRFGKWMVNVSSPKASKMIYNDTITFPKVIPGERLPNSIFSKFMGINLVFSNHEVWKRHRKVINPPFKKKFEVGIFSDRVKDFFKVVEEKLHMEEVDVYKYMQRITMDALGKGVLGVEFDSVTKDNVPFIEAYNSVMKESFKPLYMVFPFLDAKWNPFRNKAFSALNCLDTHFSEILELKKKQLKEFTDTKENDADMDILSLMLQARDSEELAFTDQEVRDNIMIFILAGHDTTAFALSVALHYLAQNPNIQEKARKEVLKVMGITDFKTGPLDQMPIPTFSQTKEMEFVLAIMKESIRLYPSVARLPNRTTSRDVEIEGYLIPKNTEVQLDIFSMQRDPDNFKNPDEFIPERFIKDSPFYHHFGDDTDLMSYTPFGGGARSCIGMNFSLLEQKIVLSMILLRYNISYPASSPQAKGASMLLGPGNVLTPANLYLNFEIIDC